MRRSRIMTSGTSCSASSSASRPLAACATTSIAGSESSARATPSRTSGKSSTTMTRIFTAAPPRRRDERDARAAARRRLERRVAADALHAPDDAAAHAEPAAAGGALGIEADAVVGDGDRRARRRRALCTCTTTCEACACLRAFVIASRTAPLSAETCSPVGCREISPTTSRTPGSSVRASAVTSSSSGTSCARGGAVAALDPAPQVARGAAREVRDLLRRQAGAEAVAGDELEDLQRGVVEMAAHPLAILLARPALAGVEAGELGGVLGALERRAQAAPLRAGQRDELGRVARRDRRAARARAGCRTRRRARSSSRALAAPRSTCRTRPSLAALASSTATGRPNIIVRPVVRGRPSWSAEKECCGCKLTQRGVRRSTPSSDL